MAVQRNAGGGKKDAGDNVRRKRRPRPPWGDLLGGKSIKRYSYVFDRKFDLGEDSARLLQYIKMLELKRHYKIDGGDYAYPIKGVGAAEWLPWYQLALAIASDLDDSLEIVDALPPGKTARRWRGIEGDVLLAQVDVLKELRPQRNVQMCLKQLKKHHPWLERYSLDQLKARYSEAKKHRRNYETARNKTRTS